MCLRVSYKKNENFFLASLVTEERSRIRSWIRIHQSEVRIRTNMSRIPNRVSQKTQHFVCASFSHSLMSLESQYGTKKIFSHQFQIYVKLENCDFSLKDRIFPVFCRIQIKIKMFIFLFLQMTMIAWADNDNENAHTLYKFGLLVLILRALERTY